MSKRPVGLLVEDIWEAVEKAECYTDNITLETFLEDTKTADAVVRNLGIIGEAASRLPDDFKAKHSEIEWVKIVGLRHRIVHDYFGVDLEIVWQILKNDLPIFKEKLKSIREKLE
jgi:uncharacterized protein with HEPN domain